MLMLSIVICFKQKTAFELRISDWSSDLCSSDLPLQTDVAAAAGPRRLPGIPDGSGRRGAAPSATPRHARTGRRGRACGRPAAQTTPAPASAPALPSAAWRSEEHTSELQSLMRISYAVFCLKKQKPHKTLRRKQ